MTENLPARAYALQQQGKTLREIGAELGKHPSQIRLHIWRGERRLRALAKLQADPLDILALADAGYMSRRLATCLRYVLKIERLDQIASCGARRVQVVPSMGAKSLAELRALMDTRGLAFNSDPFAGPRL